MLQIQLNTEDQTALRDVLGYLNFSSGNIQPRFVQGWNRLFETLRTQNIRPVWSSCEELLLEQLQELEKTAEPFRESNRARFVLDYLFHRFIPAYREFHKDILFHQTDEFLMNPFFLARLCRLITANEALWKDEPRLTEMMLRQANDFLGYRPIPVLEGEEKHEANPHEWVGAVPLYRKEAGAASGKYHDLVERTVAILRATDPVLLRDAWFDPDKMDELAMDPRAFDFDHPMNRRPNYQYGTWDPHTIDEQGYYRRFIIHQLTVDSILERVEEFKEKETPIQITVTAEPGGKRGIRQSDPPTKEDYLNEAAAILAGTILMGSGIPGDRVQAHDSTVTLASLMPQIVSYRDRFYELLLQKLEPPARTRLEAEAKRLYQPFGGARQDLNKRLGRKRADQRLRLDLARLYARIGYFDAARRQTEIISVASARILCRIDCLITQSYYLAETGKLRPAAAILTEIEDLLHRGIACGALPDPWSLLGFGAEYTLFSAADSTVHDHRVDDLINLLNDIFDLYSRLMKEAAATGDEECQVDLSDQMSDLAGWWDQFGSMDVSSVEGFSGQAVWESAAKVATALSVWYKAGTAAGDVAFWSRHVERFHSPKAFVLLGEALLDRKDPVSSMALLMHWLDESDQIPLMEGDYSFHSLTFRWMEDLWEEGPKKRKRNRLFDPDFFKQPEEYTRRWHLTQTFLERLEANAGIYWDVPTLDVDPSLLDSGKTKGKKPKKKKYSPKTMTKSFFNDSEEEIDEFFDRETSSDSNEDDQEPSLITFIKQLMAHVSVDPEKRFDKAAAKMRSIPPGLDAFFDILVFYNSKLPPIKETPLPPELQNDRFYTTFLTRLIPPAEFIELRNKAFADFNHLDVGNAFIVDDRSFFDDDELEELDKKNKSGKNKSGKNKDGENPPLNHPSNIGWNDILDNILSENEEGFNSDNIFLTDPDKEISDNFNEMPEDDDEEDEENGRIGIDPTCQAAYDQMTFRDSADDGIDDEMMDRGGFDPFAVTDDLLVDETDRINDRLAFIFSLMKLWVYVAGKSPLLHPDAIDINDYNGAKDLVTGWLKQANLYKKQLEKLLKVTSSYRIPKPRGTNESLMEYDQLHGTKEILLDRIIRTSVEVEDAILFLSTALGGKTSGSIFHGKKSADNLAIKTLAAMFRSNIPNVKNIWNILLMTLANESLLYVPTSRGGTPEKIVRCRHLQQTVLRLFEYAPRLGLLTETFKLLATVQQMDRIRPNKPGAITEFDRIFETATRSIAQAIASSSCKWHLRGKPFATNDQALVRYMEQAVDILLGCWLSHSQHIRISSVEGILNPSIWDRTKSFIQKYGSDLFTQKFLSFRNLRAILHQGVENYLRSLLRMYEDNRELESGERLIDDLANHRISMSEAVFFLEQIFESVAENYSEYIDYNSTTTHSDHGEKLYMLLDMLRVLTQYGRVSWNLRPVYWVHQTLIREGHTEAADLWEKSIRQKTVSAADEYLNHYQELNQRYGIWLPSIYERLSERFIRPLQINQMCGMVPEVIRLGKQQEETAERTAAFKNLEEQIEYFAQRQLGIGFETPEWLNILQEEVADIQDIGTEVNPSQMENAFNPAPVFESKSLPRAELERQILWALRHISFTEPPE